MTTHPLTSDFRSYPFLTGEEFAEVCHHLDRRYCHATLGPVRRQWKLRVCTALNTATFALGPEYSTYLQIIRPLDGELDDGDLSQYLDAFSFGDRQGGVGLESDGDRKMVEAEEADAGQTVLPSKEHSVASRATAGHGHVRYEIHLHPTYQAPCLWFSLHDLPGDEQEQALHIDTVFRRLVPDQFKEGLRGSVGGIGGISVDHHPVTGLPTFFIHPCLLGEAMSRFDCSKENYLMVWLGLVGGCVGLWVPAEMAVE
ncbi:ubiquitin-like-conjugating enzyme ATG10 [Staphylotrichum tortipilum]|uniref:Ubiquitin-like-conjugating enzyme ATG10 n=1 Tax=Staphylotrichum tortipilum TaxID=2831512 RepID=A0AAN6MC66_9PEZI|nr:ubiquitin-like-conjugating enzyme ATG10 [Staphylotrichum longicolle]